MDNSLPLCIFPEGDCQNSEFIARELRLHPMTAWLLYQRGARTVQEAREFLNPSLEDLHDPYLFPSMTKAVDRVAQAISKSEKIMVYGDFDADGITSTALLIRFIRFLGGQVSHHIPHRIEDGYGIHQESLEKAAADGVELIISVDNGIRAREEIQLARDLGMDFIITDHHTPPEGELPPALAIINPKVEDCSYPFTDLAGAGVAFKFAWALGDQLCSLGQKRSSKFREMIREISALAALGTISDVVPLLGENRIIAAYGLEFLPEVESPGLQALLRTARVKAPLKPRDISFRVAPLINAVGRLGHSDICIELLETDSSKEAKKLSNKLSQKNSKRQKMCRHIYRDALGKIRQKNLDSDSLMVLNSPHWHPGLIGVVASRLATEFHRPVILIAQDGDFSKGSARSVFPYSIYPAIQHASSHLHRFGGHSMAAGFELDTNHIDSFRTSIKEYGVEEFGEGLPRLSINVDGEISLSKITPSLVRELERFAPFGQHNSRPTLCTRNVTIAGRPECFGSRDRHLRFHVKEKDTVFSAVAMGKGDLLEELDLKSGRVVNIFYYPLFSDYKKEIELKVRHILTKFVTAT